MTPPPTTRVWWLAPLAVLALCAPARADDVTVTVVEVAGDVAYVTPGGDAGLAPGTRVRLGGRQLVVIDVTAGTAALRLDGGTAAVGATGVAAVVAPGTEATVGPRAPVRPLDTWREQWPAPVVPAARQHPAQVPLGAGGPVGRVHASLRLHGAGTFDRKGPQAAAVEVRAAISAEPWRERPLGVDLDIAGRYHWAGTSGARTPVIVREAQVRWGPAAHPRVALGRLAWAADAVGLLDGVRASARAGAFEVAGFGGLVPDPIDARPDTRAARFGAEAIWDRPDDAWRPRLSLTALGSTWDGGLDERRLSASAEAGRDPFDLAAWGEAQSFAAGNPWGAPAVQLIGAGASVSWHRRGRRASLDASFQRPERSLRLAAALPPSWLCWRVTSTDDATAPCAGDDWWASTSASAGAGGARWSVDGSATVGTTHGDGRFVDGSALVLGELRVLPAGLRLLAGGSGGRARFLDWYGAELGLAVPAVRGWDLSARWRPELIAYTGALDRFVIHTLIVDGRWSILPGLDLSASALATSGEDREAIALFTTVAWRPLP
jgi:hypothetical protein